MRIGNASFSPGTKNRQGSTLSLYQVRLSRFPFSPVPRAWRIRWKRHARKRAIKRAREAFLPLTRNVLAYGRFIEVWGKKGEKSEATDGKN